MEALIQNIQASRNKAMPTLYLGGLQMNTDQYFSANNLHNQDDVPEPPKKIFRNYGATFEIDQREYAMVQPQVPRNPEQEALNEYFNRDRIKRFATGQANFMVQEQLNKQAELLANQLVKDEVDRRAGIRRAVLEATGLTPAQIQTQMANEGLAGINPSLIDIRERQVQDAVNLYYNQNNIPVPVTTPFEPSTNLAPTLPQEARELLPLNESEAAALEDQAVLQNNQDQEDQTDGGYDYTRFLAPEPVFPANNINEVELPVPNVTGSNVKGGLENYSNPYPISSSYVIPNHIYDIVNDMTTDRLIDYIYDNNILNAATKVTQGAGMGNFKTRETLTRKVGREALKNIVAEHMANNSSSVANKNTSSLQKY